MKSKKVLLLAKIFNIFYISEFLYFIINLFYKKHIRIINYHKTPLNLKNDFEKQIIHLLKKYQPLNSRELFDFLETGKYIYKKPGIIFTFDDGFKSNLNIIPLLEKYKISAFFFISPNLVGKKETEYYLYSKEEYMNWEELEKIKKYHTIGSHTLNHVRMYSNLKEEDIYDEIIKSKKILEDKLKIEINTFCWVGGEENTYSPIAEKLIRKHYKYVFRTNCCFITKKTNKFLLERTNIEINWPEYLVDFYLSVFVDFIYFFKRRRLAKLYANYK